MSNALATISTDKLNRMIDQIDEVRDPLIEKSRQGPLNLAERDHLTALTGEIVLYCRELRARGVEV